MNHIGSLRKTNGEQSMISMTECPYDNTECIQDDYESICNDCKTDRVEFLNDLYMDTYD